MADQLQPEIPRTQHPVATAAAGGPAFRYAVEAVPVGEQDRATIVLLRMAGEIDLLTQGALEAAMGSGLQAAPRHLIVDLSAVTFCGARGLMTVADTAGTAAGQRIDYAVSGLSPYLGRAASRLWGPGGPTRYRSLAVAMTAIRAAHARSG